MKIGTNQRLLCNFLLVFNRYYMPIFYRFRDITIYWSEICVFAIFTKHSLVWSTHKGGSPVTCDIVYEIQSQDPGLLGGENRVIRRSLVSTQYQRMTNRQTDTPVIARLRMCTVDARQILNLSCRIRHIK